MGSQGDRWPIGLFDRAKELIESGKTIAETARLIRMRPQQLKAKLRYDKMDADEKHRRALRQREYRRHYLRRPGGHLERPVRAYDPMQTPARLQFERPAPKPDTKLLAERDRRLSIAPRDLTAQLLGDPLPGFSALDRRKNEPVLCVAKCLTDFPNTLRVDA
jgi:hypothetical protein